MHLGIILPCLDVGGAEKVLIAIANELATKGWRVDLILFEAKGLLLNTVSSHVSIVDLKCKRHSAAILWISKYYNSAKPDVVLSSMYGTGLVAVLAKFAALHKPRIYIGAHNSLKAKAESPDNLKDGILLGRMAKILFPFATGIISVSEGVACEVSELTKVPRSRVHVAYNPIITAEISASLAQEYLPLRSRLASKVVLGVGRLVKQKSFADLIRAVSIVRETREVELWLVGDGPERDHLVKLVADLGISGAVHFWGYQENPWRYMMEADLFVLSSRWEGFGNVIVEAMYCGCPVVSTDCPHGPREILQGNLYGKLTPPGDYRALAVTILETLEKGPRKETDIDGLRSRALDFTLDRSVASYTQILSAG